MRSINRRVAIVALLLLCASACNRETGPSPVTCLIEYRVNGTVAVATIRYSNSTDGFAQVTTGLPFVYSVISNRPTQFLTLDAASTTFGFLQVQIFVNGTVFRDANVTASSPSVGVSGTLRAW